MLRLDAMACIGHVVSPVPEGMSVLAAERYLKDRFKHERAVLYVTPERIGTGIVDFDLDLDAPADYQAPRFGVTFLVAARISDVAFQTLSYFDTIAIMRALESTAPFEVRSAAGGGPMFNVIATTLTGVRL